MYQPWKTNSTHPENNCAEHMKQKINKHAPDEANLKFYQRNQVISWQRVRSNPFFNLKICNLVALISRILSLTVHGVTQCNLLTYVCSAVEIRKKSHFVGSPHLTGKLNIDYHTLLTMSVLFILTTAVSCTSPHDSGHNYSSCGLISSDSRSLNEKGNIYKRIDSTF